ncbi:MAG TPA: hypothetical protein VFD58_18535 [Blastocatellia bacterium]|nr:hypothetical protein [Blastocatellia bacterium]
MKPDKTGLKDAITAFLNKQPIPGKLIRSNGTSLLSTGGYEIARHRDGVLYVRSLRYGSKGLNVTKQIDALAIAVRENSGLIVWSHTPITNSVLHTVDEIYLERERPDEGEVLQAAAGD